MPRLCAWAVHGARTRAPCMDGDRRSREPRHPGCMGCVHVPAMTGTARQGAAARACSTRTHTHTRPHTWRLAMMRRTRFGSSSTSSRSDRPLLVLVDFSLLLPSRLPRPAEASWPPPLLPRVPGLAPAAVKLAPSPEALEGRSPWLVRRPSTAPPPLLVARAAQPGSAPPAKAVKARPCS